MGDKILCHFHFKYPFSEFSTNDYPDFTIYSVEVEGSYPIDDITVILPQSQIASFAKLVVLRTRK